MKVRTVYRCAQCGSCVPRWAGRCGTCGEWNSLVEETPSLASSGDGSARFEGREPVVLASIDTTATPTVPTGIDEFDRMLGGGFVPGSVTLLSGEPGIGKSTLVLQIAAAIVSRGERALIVSGEESADQIARRAARLGVDARDVAVVSTTSLEEVLATLQTYRPSLVVVDSIQTIVGEAITGGPGSVSQVRECAAALVSAAKSGAITTILNGHVTKEGTLAGPRTLEHLVDTVCSLDGDRHHAVRVASVTKHRFGPTGELAIFEMTGEGLIGVSDPSAFLLGDRRAGIAGSLVVPAIEGVRPILVEVQALVVPSMVPTPRRIVQGMVPGRVSLVAAVLERRANIRLSASDIFASIVGGVRVVEPATDLALGLSLYSAVSGVPLADDLVAFGEIGLAGEIRQVAHAERRLQEAHRHGFRRAVVPRSCPRGPAGMTLERVGTLADAIGCVGAAPPREAASELMASSIGADEGL